MWEGTTQGHEFQQARLTGPSWKLATTTHLSMEPYSKEAPEAYSLKALKSLLKSLEEGSRRNYTAECPAEVIKFLFMCPSPQSHTHHSSCSAKSPFFQLPPIFTSLLYTPCPHTPLQLCRSSQPLSVLSSPLYLEAQEPGRQSRHS